MVKISAIMCAYNSAKTLRRAVDCLINQTMSDIEIILVNDGSEDESWDIIREYASLDSRIIPLSHNNMGHGLSRNEALKVASGEYLAFMDSDDEIALDTFEEMYTKTGNGKIDVVVCNHNRVYPGRVRKNVREMPDRIIDLEEYGRKRYIEHFLITYRHELGVYNKLIRRSILVENGILFSDNKEVLFDDVLPALELACVAGTVCSYNKSFYNYYIHEGSISDMGTAAKRMPDCFPLLVEYFRQFLEDRNLIDDIGELLPEYYYSQVFFGLIRAKRIGHADVSGAAEKLASFDHYKEYMEKISRFSVRSRFVSQIASKLSIFKSFPVIGLCWMTLIQGGKIAKFALADNYEEVDRSI